MKPCMDAISDSQASDESGEGNKAQVEVRQSAE